MRGRNVELKVSCLRLSVSRPQMWAARVPRSRRSRRASFDERTGFRSINFLKCSWMGNSTFPNSFFWLLHGIFVATSYWWKSSEAVAASPVTDALRKLYLSINERSSFFSTTSSKSSKKCCHSLLHWLNLISSGFGNLILDRCVCSVLTTSLMTIDVAALGTE